MAAHKTLSYYPHIDGLRALAVISVICFHFFPTILPSGFIGVDIFFVISGFLITSILWRDLQLKEFSLWHFYDRRIRRIFPSLLIVMGALTLLGWNFFLPTEYVQLGKYLAGGAGFASNYLLWKEVGYFDGIPESKPLLHLWSLAVEEQFYIIWPILLWAIYRLRFQPTAAIILIATSSLAFNLIIVQHDEHLAFYSPFTRAWEFLIGSLIAYQNPLRWRHSLLPVLGALLLLIGLAAIDRFTPFPSAWTLLPVLGTALLLISPSHTSWIHQYFLSSPPMIWIGKISYPLYLWHWALFSAAYQIVGAPPTSQQRILLLMISLTLAWICQKWLETPIRSTKKPLKTSLILFASMMLMGGIGYGNYTHKEFIYSHQNMAEIQNLLSTPDFQWPQHIRFEKCHIQDPKRISHDPTCIEKGHPSVGLWGDSHASSFYPGLKKLQNQRHFALTQLTQAGCPPLFNLPHLLYRPNCDTVNRQVLEEFTHLKPDILILDAAWLHRDYPLTISQLNSHLEESLRRIRSHLPHTQIILLGPAPRWKISPQKTMIYAWKATGDKNLLLTNRIPTLQLDAVEQLLKRTAGEHEGVTYISATAALCNEEGCLTRVGDAPTDWTSIDFGHLSKAGAEFLASEIGTELLSSIETKRQRMPPQSP